MGTRSIIKVPNACAAIYKHWDGNPDHMLPWLQKFNMAFTKARGIDPEYKLAQCLRFAALHASEYGLDGSDITGWGIVPVDTQYGQDYTYTLEDDGTVTVKD